MTLNLSSEKPQFAPGAICSESWFRCDLEETMRVPVFFKEDYNVI